jgi:hypothetical protein
MKRSITNILIAWARAARLLMDREPAVMSKEEAQLVQAIQQDMLQLN